MKNFFNILTSIKQNSLSKLKLNNARKQSLISELVALSLKSKFSRLKFNCSLKSYAKSVIISNNLVDEKSI